MAPPKEDRKLELRILKKADAKGKRPVYGMPPLRRTRLKELYRSGLIEEILGSGARVQFELGSTRLPQKGEKGTELVELGAHVEDVRPMKFRPRDTVVISVAMYGLGN